MEYRWAYHNYEEPNRDAEGKKENGYYFSILLFYTEFWIPQKSSFKSLIANLFDI